MGSPRALEERRGNGNKAARRGVVSVSASGDDEFIDAIDKAKKPVPMSFKEKLVAAFHIFFPPKVEESSARIEAKKRLRMILVADRCSMTPSSLKDMKKSIVSAISDYVEVDEGSDVDLSVSTHPDLGTIYSVSVPVKRVKGQFEFDDGFMETEIDGMTLKFEEEKEGKSGKKQAVVTISEKKKVEQQKEKEKKEKEPEKESE